MAFQATSGALLETDDGGIFRRTTPSSTSPLAYGDWTSLNGDLQVTEEHSCFYDHAAQVIFCGNQDNGDSQQSAVGSTTWNMVPQGDNFIADGAKVAVGYNGASSVQYWSRQFLGGFSRRTCSPACGASTLLGLLVTTNALPTFAGAFCAAHPTLLRCTDGGTQFYTVIAADSADATGAQMVLGTSGNVYESFNNGDNLTRINLPNGGVVGALAYGGVDTGTPHADVLYVGAAGTVANGALYLRPAGGALAAIANYPATAGAPTAIALDPANWKTAFVTDGVSVWQTPDATAATPVWNDITGNLPRLGELQILSIAIVPGGGTDAIVVGTDVGVFMTQANSLNCSGLGGACRTTWAPFGTMVPQTLAYSVVYDSTDDVLVVGTLGRGAYKLAAAHTITSGANHLYGASAADQPYEIDLPLVVTSINSHSGSIDITGSGGNFTLTFSGQTTTAIAVGSAPSVVQAALAALSTLSGVAVTVTQSGTTYTIDVQSPQNISDLTGQIVLTGTVPRTTSPLEFASLLQTQANATLEVAGDGAIRVQVDLTADGFLRIGQTGANSGRGLQGLKVTFPEPIVADSGGGRISLSARAVTFTPGPGLTPINRSFSLNLNVTYDSSSFQELGLSSSPTPFTFNGSATPDIEFRLHVSRSGSGPSHVSATAGSGGSLAAGTYFYVVTAVSASGESVASDEVSATLGSTGTITVSWSAVTGATGYRVYRGASAGAETDYYTVTGGSTTTLADDDTGTKTAGNPPSAGPSSAEVPVFLAGSTSYATIADLVSALQTAINAALVTYTGSSDANGDGVPDVLVCRPGDDPTATGPSACSGVGNRILFRGEKGVVSGLSIDVPARLDQGTHVDSANGAVTELGYAASQGETHTARASRFFLKDVNLTGTFDVIVQNLSVTANVGFLAVKATAQGTLGGTGCSRSRSTSASATRWAEQSPTRSTSVCSRTRSATATSCSTPPRPAARPSTPPPGSSPAPCRAGSGPSSRWPLTASCPAWPTP